MIECPAQTLRKVRCSPTHGFVAKSCSGSRSNYCTSPCFLECRAALEDNLSLLVYYIKLAIDEVFALIYHYEVNNDETMQWRQNNNTM